MDVECFFDETKLLLCCEAPFEMLRLRSFRVTGRDNDYPLPFMIFPNDSALSLARDLPSCACLEEQTVNNAPLHVPRVWEALSVACLKLTELSLSHCHLQPHSVPGLVMLPSEGCLTSLWIGNSPDIGDGEIAPLFDEPGGIAFGDALRANKKLKALELSFLQLWDVLPAGIAIINGVVGHATLEELQLRFNSVAVEKWSTVGDVLGRLIAVPSVLVFLILAHCDLSDVGLRPLFQALPGNASLRLLCVFGDHEVCTS